MSENTKKYPSATEKKGFSVRNILSIIAVVIGGLSFLFLLTKGISYTNANYSGYYSDSELHMSSLIFGNGVYRGVNPGLLSAFIIMLSSIVLAVLMNWFNAAGYLSILGFITSAVLWFCTVPLFGVSGASLSVGAWFLGILNIVDAILVFIGTAY